MFINIKDRVDDPKVRGVVAAIEEAGAMVLFLPPYSPDFNPIGSGSFSACLRRSPVSVAAGGYASFRLLGLRKNLSLA